MTPSEFAVFKKTKESEIKKLQQEIFESYDYIDYEHYPINNRTATENDLIENTVIYVKRTCYPYSIENPHYYWNIVGKSIGNGRYVDSFGDVHDLDKDCCVEI